MLDLPALLRPDRVVRVPHAALQRLLADEQPPRFLDDSKAAFGRVQAFVIAGM